MEETEKWKNHISKGRNGVSRPCANNTTVRIDGENVIFKLHATDVVTLMSNGDAILNSGGWRSRTTKERITRYTNANICSRGGIWYCKDDSLFYDGMVIDFDGFPLKPKATKRYEKQVAKIKRDAGAYATKYVDALKAGLVGFPSPGDCLVCQGLPWGSDHLKSHIKESYFVPSLLINAGRDAGYRDDQLGLMGMGGYRVFIEPKRIIYKYLVKQLQADLKG